MKRTNKKRIGQFFIPRQAIFNNQDDVLAIMQHVIVVRAEMHLNRDGVEYVGYSDLFDEIEEGLVAPHYTFTIHREDYGDGYIVSVKEVMRIDPHYTPPPDIKLNLRP